MNIDWANYKEFGPLQDLALELQTSIVLVHHLRKADSKSPNKRMIGSVALSACGSSGWVLTRAFNSSKGVLQISAKEMADKAYKLEFNAETLEWLYNGEQIGLNLTPDRQNIVDVFLANGNLKLQTATNSRSCWQE